MKFKYDLYRPKRIVEDVQKLNRAYFHAKDVRVTPLTKIGDADEVYKSQSTGRIPALAQRFKRKRLTLSEILPRRRRIPVHSADHQKEVAVRVSAPASALAKQAKPLKAREPEQSTKRLATLGGELATAMQRNWATRRAALSQLGLVLLVIGAGAGSVHAYINRSHAQHTDSSAQTTSQTSTPNTEQGTKETPPPPPPEPPATPTPDTQPTTQAYTPPANDTPDSQSSPLDGPTGVTHSDPKPVPAPAPPTQDTNNPAPPATAPAPPTNPTPPPTTDPSNTPTSPQEPTTPPNDETDTPPTPDETQQTTSPSTSTNESITSTASPDSSSAPTPAKGHKPSAQDTTTQ